MIRRAQLIGCVALAFFGSANPLRSAQVRLLYSSSLNGNLDGCTCKIQPISGLVKRGAFVEAYRTKYKDALLLDSGDLILDPRKTKLNEAIFRSYALLRYDAVALGDQDLTLGPRVLTHFGRQVPFVTTNIRTRGGFFSSGRPLGQDHLLVRRSGIAIAIGGILHPDSLRFMRGPARDSWNVLDPTKAIGGLPAADLLILLSHSGKTHDLELASHLTRPAVIIGGHDQTLLESPLRLKNGSIYVQPGRDGDRLGELVLSTTGNGSFQVTEHRLHRFDAATSPDHPAIRKLIGGLGGH